jgi:murein DD-endopeptidase MepM/ murein hydrolase activator NlpD
VAVSGVEVRRPVVAQPLEAMHVTSRFGPRVRNGRAEFHNGIDLRAAVGTPVYSPFPARVVHFTNDGGGLSLLLFDEDGWRVGFAHLSQRLVRDGAEVGAGELVALSGATGPPGTQPHVHMTLRAPAQAENLDPFPFFLGGGGGWGKLVVAGLTLYAASKGLT